MPDSAATNRALLMTLEGVFRDLEEKRHYLSDAWVRIQVVLDLLGSLQSRGVRRVLELGANPYILTILLQRTLSFDLELANFFGDGKVEDRSTHVAELAGERVEFPFRHFNIETDPFPYDDESFDCVIFCEILEHLLQSPDKAVAEMSRVLRPGGFLVVSTPNATRLPQLYFLALGRNIHDWYSDNGPYGRHNREYTLGEVKDLLERHHFEVCQAHVQNIEPLARRFTYLQRLRPAVWNGHIFVVARRLADAQGAAQQEHAPAEAREEDGHDDSCR